jgi:serine/threonine protein kinase
MRFENGEIKLSRDVRKNIIEFDNTVFEIRLLNLTQKDIYKRSSKGGNSVVFTLFDNDKQIEYAIKFSKYPRIPEHTRSNNRFQHEINALYEAKDNSFENIVEIVFDDMLRIGDFNFMYYVMEKGETDLTDYLRNNNIALNQKYLLCYEIIKGINQLHSMALYHRDIKPDNIFVINNTWKIGDLGLSKYRNNDTLDKKNEKIGPVGWLSPEVMNKVLCAGTPMEAIHDCVIDEFSDIFQLGKLIWFIFNGNVPIGQIKLSDFNLGRKEIFDLIINMLQYRKRDRGRLNDYEEAFELLAN